MNFNNELERLMQLPFEELDEQQYNQTPLAAAYEEMNGHIQKFRLSQQEIGLQIEELYSSFSESDEGGKLIQALIELMDYIENLYLFTQSSTDSPLIKQSMLMWNGAVKKISLAGIAVLHEIGMPPDPQLHHIISAEYDAGMPEGVIIKTLKSGYIYDGKVLRKADVVVNSYSDIQKKEEILC